MSDGEATEGLVARIRQRFPSIESFRYYAALFSGHFTYEATMRAHLQDLARSIGCRGLREIQLAKLDKALARSTVTAQDGRALRATIEDELPGDGRPSHFEVRLQMFEPLNLSRETLETVVPLPKAQEGTRVFREIFEQRSLLEITAAVGAIEEWYVPLAARLEGFYLTLGYTARQVATYALHKQADIEHSTTALRFVRTYARDSDIAPILDAVETGFASVRQYDEARFQAATDDTRHFGDYLRS